MRKHMLPSGLAAMAVAPLFFLFVSAPVRAQPAPALTLELAQHLAESRSFAIGAARHEVEAQDGAVRQAGSWRNPELSTAVEDTQRSTRSTTATLGFPIELGGKRSARIGAADRARDLARAELAQVQAQLRADVVQAFFEVLVAQERAALAASSAELAERGAAVVGRRVAAGKVSPVDETRARVDAANARLEAAEASAELAGARESLVALWGETGWRHAELRGDLERLPDRPGLGALVAELDGAPGLLPSLAEVERRRALVDVERSRGVPDLTLSVGAKRDNDLGRTQAIVGLSIPLPLFDRNQGATHEAAQRAEKASDELQAHRLRLLAALQQASLQLALARSTVQALTTTVLPAAQQAHEAASIGFEAGKFGFLDVIDAQRSLLQARTRRLSALARTHQAAAAIDRILGR